MSNPTSNSVKGFLASVIIQTIGRLPISFSQFLGKCLAYLIFRINNREVKIARRNIALCYAQLSKAQQDSLLKQSLANFGMQVCEIAYLWVQKPKKALDLVKSIEGLELFEEAIAADKGILLILPHLGNWELVNAYILSKIPGIAMYSPAQLPEVEKLMRKGRLQTGLELAEANGRGVVMLYKRLSKGGNLFILPDQEPELSGGEFSEFFGHQALTMTMISKMINKTGAQPLLAYGKRLGLGKGFSIVFKPVSPELASADIKVSLSALNEVVENSIREVPEQYMWGYKRFRTRPEGEQSLYKDLK